MHETIKIGYRTFASCFFFPQPFYKLFVRGAGDDSIELRTIIIDDTDILHDGIVGLPLTIHLPQLVNAGISSPLG
jgi:hypothetical protein